MNITIKPGAATDDARQIENIVSAIKEDMETLNTAIRNTIPTGIQTSWAKALGDDWKQYYTGDIPAAMEDMEASARNLNLAVEQALKYDQEKM